MATRQIIAYALIALMAAGPLFFAWRYAVRRFRARRCRSRPPLRTMRERWLRL